MNRAALLLLTASALLLLATQASAQQGDGNAPDDPDAGEGDWRLPGMDAAANLFNDAVGAMTMQDQGRMSPAGLAMLEQFEGFSATPYADHKGNSIGFGHLIQPGEDYTYLTREQGEQLLAQDVASAERTVSAAVSVPLNQGQFDALVSFTYNVGAGAFRASTLLRKLNAGDYAGAAAEFPRWVNASGQRNETLVARRDQEQALFEA
jgi:lysozyme